MSRPVLLYASLIVGTLIVVALATFRPIRVLPRLGPAPGFALTNQDGERLTSEDLRGAVTLYDFTDLACDGPCAETTQVMRAVQDQLAELDEDVPPVRLVTISLDGQRDTPEALRAAATAAGADLERWRFATGNADLLKMVVTGGFEVEYAPQADGSVQHEPTMVLVDGWGLVRAEYRATTPTTQRVVKDIQSVAKEARQSRGPARLAYEATHLFVCH